jgi:hypothetical protein
MNKNTKFTKLPDGSAFGVFSISIPWYKNLWKKMKMLDWWLRKPRYRCPECGKGLYTYWDGNDVTGHGIDYCDKCAKQLES